MSNSCCALRAGLQAGQCLTKDFKDSTLGTCCRKFFRSSMQSGGGFLPPPQATGRLHGRRQSASSPVKANQAKTKLILVLTTAYVDIPRFIPSFKPLQSNSIHAAAIS